MGAVTDENGSPLPGVTVEISSPSLLGGVHSQITGADGEYRFINLPPANYTAVFKLKGFQTIERTGIIVSVNMRTVENITLKLSALEESVIVTAAAPIVDVTRSGISTTYSKVQIEKLPFARNTYFDIVN